MRMLNCRLFEHRDFTTCHGQKMMCRTKPLICVRQELVNRPSDWFCYKFEKRRRFDVEKLVFFWSDYVLYNTHTVHGRNENYLRH